MRAPTVTAATDAVDATLRVNLRLARARVLVGLAGLVAVWGTDYDAQFVLQVVASVGLTLLVVWGAALPRLAADGASSDRVDEISRAIGLVCVATVLPVAPHADLVYVGFVLLLLLVMEALRGGVAAVRTAVGVAAVTEVGRQALSWSQEGHLHLLEMGLGMGIATAIGLVVARLHEEREQSLTELARMHVRAREQADRSERLLGELAMQHRVMASGIGGGADDVLARVSHEIRDELGLLGVGVLLLDEQGRPTIGGSTMAETYPMGSPVALVPGGTVERALASRSIARATASERAEIQRRWPNRRNSVVAPLVNQRGVVGALVCDDGALVCDDGAAGSRLDDRLLASLADLIVLVLDAGRALDEETVSAQRFRELDRLKTEFVAITSHELRTPVSAIAGCLETLELRREQLDVDTRDALLRASRRQATRLTRLVDDLRTVSRMDAGELGIELAAVDLSRSVAFAVASIEQEGASGQCDVASGPAVAVTADRGRLEQVLINLVRNGFEHGAGHVEISWTLEGHEAVLTIADDGPGIPTHLRDRLFDRYSRGASVDRHSRGMGLGLAIARELAEAMGGNLDLSPDDHDGACFELRLALTGVRPALSIPLLLPH